MACMSAAISGTSVLLPAAPMSARARSVALSDAGVTPSGTGCADPMGERLTAHTGMLHSRPRPASANAVDDRLRISMTFS